MKHGTEAERERVSEMKMMHIYRSMSFNCTSSIQWRKTQLHLLEKWVTFSCKLQNDFGCCSGANTELWLRNKRAWMRVTYHHKRFYAQRFPANERLNFHWHGLMDEFFIFSAYIKNGNGCCCCCCSFFLHIRGTHANSNWLCVGGVQINRACCTKYTQIFLQND